MRFAWLIAVLILAGCSSTGRQPEPGSDQVLPPLEACVDPRPEVCTLEYAPVCADLSAGGRREYASGCNACSDSAVAGYRNGPCPE